MVKIALYPACSSWGWVGNVGIIGYKGSLFIKNRHYKYYTKYNKNDYEEHSIMIIRKSGCSYWDMEKN